MQQQHIKTTVTNSN